MSSFIKDESHPEIVQFVPRTTPIIGLSGSPTNGALWYDTITNSFQGVVNGSISSVGGSSVGYTPMVLGIPLANLKIIPLNGQVTATGAQTLYTVPTGKKAMALIASVTNFNVSSAGPYNFGWQLLTEGLLFPCIGPITTIASGATSQPSPQGQPFVATAGDALISNLNLQPYNLRGCIYEFDGTSPIFSVRQDLTAGGDFTLFTCPAGKKAILGSQYWSNNSFANAAGLICWNVSGSNKTITPYIIPTGFSKDTTTQAQATVTSFVSGTWANPLLGFLTFNSGDVFLVNAVTGGGSLFAFATGVLF